MGVHYPYGGNVMISLYIYIYIYIYIYASCAKGIVEVWTLIIARKFNEHIAKTIISVVDVAWIKIWNSFVIPSYGCCQII
jgi:hypothetical protein